MNDYTIFTDSTCDLPPSMYAQNDLSYLQFSFTLDDKTYSDDGTTLFEKAFYDKMRAGAMPVTAQLNPENFIECLTPELRAGRDVICLVFASACSGTYQSARMAVEELRIAYPDRKIYAIDSTCESGGEGRLALAMAEKKREGMDIDTLFAWV